MALAPLVSAAIVIGSQAYNNLFGGEKTTIGTFEIDAVRAIDHNQEYVVNQKPVETGMEFTDQHIKKFAQINIEGILSNGKLTFEGFVDDFRKKEMALSKLADSGIPVELVTELKSYENVIFFIISRIVPYTTKFLNYQSSTSLESNCSINFVYSAESLNTGL